MVCVDFLFNLSSRYVACNDFRMIWMEIELENLRGGKATIESATNKEFGNRTFYYLFLRTFRFDLFFAWFKIEGSEVDNRMMNLNVVNAKFEGAGQL